MKWIIIGVIVAIIYAISLLVSTKRAISVDPNDETF